MGWGSKTDEACGKKPAAPWRDSNDGEAGEVDFHDLASPSGLPCMQLSCGGAESYHKRLRNVSEQAEYPRSRV